MHGIQQSLLCECVCVSANLVAIVDATGIVVGVVAVVPLPERSCIALHPLLDMSKSLLPRHGHSIRKFVVYPFIPVSA